MLPQLVVDWARIMQGRITAIDQVRAGQVTVRRVILLLLSLINDIYVVICIGLIRSNLRLWNFILSLWKLLVDISLYQHTDFVLVYSYMLCMYKTFLAFIVPVVIPILPGQPFWLDPTSQAMVDPWANTVASTLSITTYSCIILVYGLWCCSLWSTRAPC